MGSKAKVPHIAQAYHRDERLIASKHAVKWPVASWYKCIWY